MTAQYLAVHSLDELKAKKITKTTSVWCEGMEDWNTAGSVEELKKTLFSTPPQIKSFVAPSTPLKMNLQMRSKSLHV
jgi:hypothetical protein